MDDSSILVVEDLREQVKRLEARITGIESHNRADFIHDTTGDAEQEESSVGGYRRDHDQQTSSTRIIPEVRKCNFMEFKNHFTEEDGVYAIDVLESGVLLDQEIQLERNLRERLTEISGRTTSRAAKRKADAIMMEANRTNEALRKAQSDDVWIRRIRLQSPALLRIFSKIQGETWSARPRVYYRPFCPLIYYLPQIKLALVELEKRWGSCTDVSSKDTSGKKSGDYVDGGEDGEEWEDVEETIDDSPAALDVMRCFVAFLEKEVVPDSDHFASLDYSNDAKVRFYDLCYLFKTGDIIYRPVEGDLPGCRDARMGQRAWRVYHTDYSSGIIQGSASDHHNFIHHGLEVNDGLFTIQSYCIEHTGDELGVITNSFTITPYEGLKPVNSLPIFPLRFLADHKAFFQGAMEKGDKVLRAIETKHATYNGWTIMRTPKGGFVTDANGAILKHPEHVNSEVMVDYGEAFQACPSWRPERTVLKPETVNQTTVSDDFNIRWWSGPDRARLLTESSEITPHRTGVHILQRNKLVSEDLFLAADRNNQQTGQRTTEKHLRSEDKVLITCRVFAYVFRERKFAMLDVQRLKPSTQSWEALDSLKIPKITKDLIQGSVRGHFIQKESEKRNGEEGLSLDLIQGKGTGLFILLHGVPGVGKTATAEAVAQANGKPLFKITVGDLGLTPDQVECSLRHIFRLASNWDCILLMDEVDTFFSQRSKGDAAMTKNALVSGKCPQYVLR
jgi:ATPase family associated with various cellular activities (AAA)